MPLDREATQRFYDRISGVYDLISDRSEQRFRDRGVELLAVEPGQRVLEIGFGTGHCLVALAEATGSTGRVDGMDISPGMVEVATKRVEEAGLDNVHLKTAACPPLPFEDSVFDAVFLSFTLELFPDEETPQVLSEIARVLVPTGKLGIVAMARPKPDEKVSVLEFTYQWMHRHFPHIVDCAPIDLDSMLEQAGFELLHNERMSMFTMPVAVTVSRSGSP